MNGAESEDHNTSSKKCKLGGDNRQRFEKQGKREILRYLRDVAKLVDD